MCVCVCCVCVRMHMCIYLYESHDSLSHGPTCNWSVFPSLAGSQDYDGGTLDIVIQPGTHRATLNITALADSILEQTENFFAILSIPSGTRGVVVCDQSIATVTIIDQTTTSVVFLQDSASAVEGGPAFLVLRLTGGVSVGPNMVLTVNIALRNGTATGELPLLHRIWAILDQTIL